MNTGIGWLNFNVYFSTDFIQSMTVFNFTGRKTGKGIYLYEGQGKDRPVNPEFLSIIKTTQREPRVPYVLIGIIFII